MKIYVTQQLSPHKYRTPEGYLICTDAVLARTGKQLYKKKDFFPDAADGDADYEVDRKAEDVFKDTAIASFENKPICIEHPDENVTSTNWKEYQVGYVRDVHKGEFEGQPVLLGNLVIQDEAAISAIENGDYKELSCGYDCDIADEENPCQRNIIGNHVALCKEGRAGIAHIQDSKTKDANHYIIYSSKEKAYLGYGARSWLPKEHPHLDRFTTKEEAEAYMRKHVYAKYKPEVVQDSKTKDEVVLAKTGEKVKELAETYYIERRKDGQYYIVSGDSGYDRPFKSAEEAENFWLNNKALIRSKVAKDSVKDEVSEGMINPGAKFITKSGVEWRIINVDNHGIVRYEYDTSGAPSRNAEHISAVKRKLNMLGAHIKDSTKDVEPQEGEDKQSFISRFMSSTKEEYPDKKQRLAVAYSYWDKHSKKDCSKQDCSAKDYDNEGERQQQLSIEKATGWKLTPIKAMLGSYFIFKNERGEFVKTDAHNRIVVSKSSTFDSKMSKSAQNALKIVKLIEHSKK